MSDFMSTDTKPEEKPQAAAAKKGWKTWLAEWFPLLMMLPVFGLIIWGAILSSKTTDFNRDQMMRCLRGNLATCSTCAANDDLSGDACREILWQKASLK